MDRRLQGHGRQLEEIPWLCLLLLQALHCKNIIFKVAKNLKYYHHYFYHVGRKSKFPGQEGFIPTLFPDEDPDDLLFRSEYNLHSTIKSSTLNFADLSQGTDHHSIGWRPVQIGITYTQGLCRNYQTACPINRNSMSKIWPHCIQQCCSALTTGLMYKMYCCNILFVYSFFIWQNEHKQKWQKNHHTTNQTTMSINLDSP